MSHLLPATQSRRREKRIALRLIDLLEALDLPDRKALLPAEFAGKARRTLMEAEAIIQGNLLPPAGTRSPGEIFAAALLNLKLISPRNDLARKANSRSQKNYPPYLPGRCNLAPLARWRARLQTSSRQAGAGAVEVAPHPVDISDRAGSISVPGVRRR